MNRKHEIKFVRSDRYMEEESVVYFCVNLEARTTEWLEKSRPFKSAACET